MNAKSTAKKVVNNLLSSAHAPTKRSAGGSTGGNNSPTAKSYINNRFYVFIDGVANAVFTEVSGLQVETEVLEYAEGGNNGFVHRLPGRTRVGNITLKRGLIGKSEFLTWLREMNNNNIQKRNVSLVMYDMAGNEIVRWDFLDAYPVRWIGPQFDAKANSVAIETIELAHAGLQMG